MSKCWVEYRDSVKQLFVLEKEQTLLAGAKGGKIFFK